MARDNSGALFTREGDDSEDAPYASGKMVLEGKDYYLDAWKITEDGEEQLDIRFKAKSSSKKSSDGDGFMRRNQKTAEKHPDWKGEIQKDGTKYKVAGWRRKSEKGLWYLSVAIELPQAPKSQTHQEEDPNAGYPF